MALTDNLQAYWPLTEREGNRADLFGIETLTDNNTVMYDSGMIPSSDGALFTAANSESLSRADDAGMSINGHVDFAFSLWVRFNTLVSGMRVIGKWNNTPSNEYTLLLNPTLNWAVSSDGTTSTQIGLILPLVGVTYHVVVWHDSVADVVGMTINGTMTTTSPHTTGCFQGTSAFRIGSLDGGAQYFDGVIGQVGFWKGRVLSSDEILALYNSGQGNYYPFQRPYYFVSNYPKTVMRQGAHL